MLYFYGFVSQQVTSEKSLCEPCWMIYRDCQIDGIIRGIIFYGFADHILHPVRARESSFLGPLLKKKQELGGPMFINRACSLYKRLLGTSGVMHVKSKLRGSKFSQMEE
jgi:hypothetical protein